MGAAAPPAEEEVIIAPLIGPGGVAALLRISARHPGTFGLYECDLVTSLLPQAMVAIHNAEQTESLQDRVLQAERKHAMAELARGVSHDVNNALGSMLPLIQQLREEAADGRIDPATLAADLAQIEHSVHVCTRIFGGMLKFARHASSASATARGSASTPSAGRATSSAAISMTSSPRPTGGWRCSSPMSAATAPARP